MSDETLFDAGEVLDPTGAGNKTVPLALVRQVFDYWVVTLRSSGRGVKPRLDDKRRKCIERAIRDYGVDVCMDAVRGCSLSDWHMGNNPQGKRYDDITLILRNADKIEKFANLAANEKTGWEHEQD